MDINCDMGESYGNFIVGNDSAIFPYITSCSIACGFHGGDPRSIARTIKMALVYNLRIGAHPSYPDLAGFGRRKMEMEYEELVAIIQYQVAALKAMVEAYGGRLAYVKPHGALYTTAAQEEKESAALIEAIREIDDNLYLMGFAGSITEEIAHVKNMPFIAEAFADRRYVSATQLVPRIEKNAVITSAEEAVLQVASIVHDKKITAIDGTEILINAQSICIHGDNPAAIDILSALDKMCY